MKSVEAPPNSRDHHVGFPERFRAVEGVKVDVVHSKLDVSSPVELRLVPPEAPSLDDLLRRPVFHVPGEDAYSQTEVTGGCPSAIWILVHMWPESEKVGTGQDCDD